MMNNQPGQVVGSYFPPQNILKARPAPEAFIPPDRMAIRYIGKDIPKVPQFLMSTTVQALRGGIMAPPHLLEIDTVTLHRLSRDRQKALVIEMTRFNNLMKDAHRTLIFFNRFLSKSYGLPRPVGAKPLTPEEMKFCDDCEMEMARLNFNVMEFPLYLRRWHERAVELHLYFRNTVKKLVQILAMTIENKQLATPLISFLKQCDWVKGTDDALLCMGAAIYVLSTDRFNPMFDQLLDTPDLMTLMNYV